MKKGTVHFTLGDDAGKLLMQIAQEALLYELDPEKAIKVITTSLMGCPDNIALKILKGDTDKYQWFTDGDLWFKCGDEVCNEGRKIHKATVNELIEHFKIKEEQ